MPTTKADKLARASAAVARARAQLAQARDGLARTSEVGSAAFVVDAEWADLYATLEGNRARLGQIPGVVGFGIGYREVDGLRTNTPCITVSVGSKWPRARLVRAGRRAVPTWLRSPSGKRVPLDVIPVGRLRRQLLAGEGMGRMQHPTTGGTLGTYATDLDTGAVVALSAMHVSGCERYPPGQVITLGTPNPPHPSVRPVGLLEKGTTSGVDAMRVALLNPDMARFTIRGIGPIRGWRPVTSGDHGTTVRMCGAVSGVQQGSIEYPVYAMPSHDLDPVMLVRIQTASGDSGAVIVDNRHLVLGLLVGELTGSSGLRAFSPISAVLAALGCDINPGGG